MNTTLINSNKYYDFSVAYYYGYAYIAVENLLRS